MSDTEPKNPLPAALYTPEALIGFGLMVGGPAALAIWHMAYPVAGAVGSAVVVGGSWIGFAACLAWEASNRIEREQRTTESRPEDTA